MCDNQSVMYHYRKTRKVYKSFPKPETCQFCDISQMEHIIEETLHARIIKNRVYYDVWESRDVSDHLMIIPKRHVRTLNDLTDEERVDIMKLIGKYEADHYNVYARSMESVTRSVPHQHTHLIKAEPKLARVTIAVRRPYWLIKF
jgi:diadenosine tetraphosphate (Ap4A) HIT family hydrolase